MYSSIYWSLNNFMDQYNYNGYAEPIDDFKVEVDLLLKEYYDSVPQADTGWADWEDFFITDIDGPPILVQQRYKLENIDESMPYTAKVIEEIKSKYDFSHVHYRMVFPSTCYGWHQDEMEVCLHVPILTNAGCWFTFAKEHCGDNKDFKVIRLPANGDVYIVNNGRHHTFVNSGMSSRVHLTFMNF